MGILIGTLSISVGLFLMQHGTAATTLSQSLKTHQIPLAVFRYALIGLFIGFWPRGIQALGQRNGWDEAFIQNLSNKRLYLCGFFILFELIVVYNVIGRLLTHLF